MKNKLKLSFEDKRELELINKYYNVDTENKIVTMPLHYDKASDLVDNTVVSKDNFLFDYEQLTMINNRISRIPIMYNVNIEIQIDDYEDYDASKLISGFNDALELNSYNYAREKRRKWLFATITLIVGLSLLFFMAYGKINNWFGEGNRGIVFGEVFDIIGWVFIWETVTVAFLTPSELGVNSKMFKRRVKYISFHDIENTCIIKEDTTKIYNEWQEEKKLAVFTRWSLLISAIAVIVFAIMDIMDSASTISSYIASGEIALEKSIYMIAFSVLIGIEAFILITAGILNLLLYMRKIKFRRASLIFTILIIIFIIIDIISFVFTEVRVERIFTLVIEILYVFGSLFTLINTRRIEKVK